MYMKMQRFVITAILERASHAYDFFNALYSITYNILPDQLIITRHILGCLCQLCQVVAAIYVYLLKTRLHGINIFGRQQ